MGAASPPNQPGARSPGGKIRPGSVFVVDPFAVYLAPIPGAKPKRETRWVVVLSSEADCDESWARTLLVAVLSRQTQHFWAQHDILVAKGDGGVDVEVLAQCDTVFSMLKADLLAGELKGIVQRDTLAQIRAKVARLIGA